MVQVQLLEVSVDVQVLQTLKERQKSPRGYRLIINVTEGSTNGSRSRILQMQIGMHKLQIIT